MTAPLTSAVEGYVFPIRLNVLRALTDAIEDISLETGEYQHDLRGRVSRGRLVYSDRDPIPMVSILEPPAQPEDTSPPQGGSEGMTELPLLIQGFAEEDRENPTDPAYLLLADVRKRLAIERIRDGGFNILGFGPRVTDLKIGQGIVRPPEAQVSPMAFFWLFATVSFAEDARSPFT